MSRPRTRRAALALLCCAALLLPAGLARAADTAAVAVNTRDGASVFRLAFSIQRVVHDVVDESNAAVAVASCTDCTTIAISLQAVLVFSDPSVVTPENLALAMNIDCTSCDTLASAYQWVLGSGGVVRFTPEGQRRVAEIRAELQRLRTAGLSIQEVQAQVDALAEELEEVLTTELELVGPVERAATPTPTASETASSGESPSAEATASASPSQEPSQQPSPSESATATPDGEASPTPTETAT